MRSRLLRKPKLTSQPNISESYQTTPSIHRRIRTSLFSFILYSLLISTNNLILGNVTMLPPNTEVGEHNDAGLPNECAECRSV
jgi:hypothetical protein